MSWLSGLRSAPGNADCRADVAAHLDANVGPRHPVIALAVHVAEVVHLDRLGAMLLSRLRTDRVGRNETSANEERDEQLHNRDATTPTLRCAVVCQGVDPLASESAP